MGEEKPFDKFQLEEYKNISNAHFESIKQISTFFRYYLLILAAPVFILNILPDKDKGFEAFLAGKDPEVYYNLVFIYFLIVAIIGFFIYLYVINLRLDAVLYARTVNKTRKYFYESSDLKIEEYRRYLQLPIVSTTPKYSEKTFFVPLLFVFSLINCGLLSAGFAIKMLKSDYVYHWVKPFSYFLKFNLPISVSLIIVLFILFFGLHVLGYYVLGHLRNTYYLKSYKIGLDIDGVLNNQTSHFKTWLKKLTDKTFEESNLKEIPVSLNEGIGVEDIDEKIVFNTKEYWESLPFKNKAAHRVKELQKRFGFKILFFSYRDWPQYGGREEEIKKVIVDKGFTPLTKRKEIKKITRDWLDKELKDKPPTNFFKCIWYHIAKLFTSKRRMILEMGNPYISDTRFWNHFRRSMLNNNRFQGASTKGFRFFVEDTPENAIKLSGLCEYVFMFDEPYNSEIDPLIKNIIRVKNWDDIYRHLKQLA